MNQPVSSRSLLPAYKILSLVEDMVTSHSSSTAYCVKRRQQQARAMAGGFNFTAAMLSMVIIVATVGVTLAQTPSSCHQIADRVLKNCRAYLLDPRFVPLCCNEVKLQAKECLCDISRCLLQSLPISNPLLPACLGDC